MTDEPRETPEEVAQRFDSALTRLRRNFDDELHPAQFDVFDVLDPIEKEKR